MGNILLVPKSANNPIAHNFTINDLEDTSSIQNRTGAYIFIRRDFNDNNDEYDYCEISFSFSKELFDSITLKKGEAKKEGANCVAILYCREEEMDKILSDISTGWSNLRHTIL